MGSHINIYICFPQSLTSFRVRGRLGNNFKVYVKNQTFGNSLEL